MRVNVRSTTTSVYVVVCSILFVEEARRDKKYTFSLAMYVVFSFLCFVLGLRAQQFSVNFVACSELQNKSGISARAAYRVFAYPVVASTRFYD